MSKIILLDHGSGGKASHRLISELFVRHFDNEILARMDDAALLRVTGPIAVSTDGYTVDPIEFPGGNIGSLAVHGTVNDVAMLGARIKYLTVGFILEEGLPLDLLDRIAASMAAAAKEAGVLIVTGDTKVVPSGAADKIFITTTGIGEVYAQEPPSGAGAREGDAVLVSGHMGDHGLTILGRRNSLDLDPALKSDCASLHRMAEALVTETGRVHVLRDPTRGGLAAALNEIAAQSGLGLEVEEDAIPVRPSVQAGCSVLGLDPLHLANEGKLVCILPEAKARAALDIMARFPEGQAAARIGKVTAGPAGKVVLRTPLGGKRLLTMPEGEILPRIC